MVANDFVIFAKIPIFAEMNNVIEHIEYLIRRHDCVVIPSWGAFIAHQQAAYYNAESSLYMPPLRQISFNVNVDHNDGLLTASIARKLDIPFSKAAKIVTQEVDAMKCQLQTDGEISLGSIGRFVAQSESSLLFEPSDDLLRDESRGFSPVEIKPVIEQVIEDEVPAAKNNSRTPRRLGLKALKIAAAIAVTISVGAAIIIPSVMNRNDNLAGIASTTSILSEIDTSSIFKRENHNATIENPESEFQASAVVSDSNVQTSDIETKAQKSLPEITSDIHNRVDKKADQTTVNISNEKSQTEVSKESLPAENNPTKQTKNEQGSLKPDASHCLVIGSLANMKQAKLFISQQAGSGYDLKIYAADGKYRVYIATGSVEKLVDLKANTSLGEDYPDAWVCKVN